MSRNFANNFGIWDQLEEVANSKEYQMLEVFVSLSLKGNFCFGLQQKVDTNVRAQTTETILYKANKKDFAWHLKTSLNTKLPKEDLTSKVD